MAIPTTPPSGFRDFLPEECERRRRSIETIGRVYRSFGFEPIDTSAVEDLAVLEGKGAGENERLIFKILKRGEKLDAARATAGGELADLGLRFDLTVPLARFFSRHGGQLPRPFKAFHIGPVWRAERAQKGRYREFLQCDADILGSDNLLCEVDVIQAIMAVFAELGVKDVTALVNDRSLLFAVLDRAGVPPERRGAACILLDKLDKTDRAEILSGLQREFGDKTAQALEDSLFASEPDLERFKSIAPEAAARLSEILGLLRLLDGKAGAFKFSPSLVRGLDYYTGPVFEFRHPGLAGSIGGGGRYDGLTEKFGGQSLAACGGSIGFERLMLLLEAGSAAAVPGPEFCVTIFSEELRSQALSLAARLRCAGRTADVYPGTGRLKAQLKYADSKRAAYAVILGPDEAAAKQVRLKDLKTGEERLLNMEALEKVQNAG